MSTDKYRVNTEDLDISSTLTYDAEVVPHEVWETVQKIHHDSIRANLPQEQWDRGDVIINLGNLEGYIGSRVNPNIQVGKTRNPNQLYKDPQLTVIFDRSKQIVGGVYTVNNASVSGRTPKSLKEPLMKLKMWMPPGIPIPKLGNRRYLHAQEAYVNPDVQSHTTEEGLIDVSGILLIGVVRALETRSSRQHATTYVVKGDPADSDMLGLAEITGMSGNKGVSHNLAGYDSSLPLIRYHRKVGQIVSTILEIPGVSSANDNVEAFRRVVPSL